jgi:hypothetical protein
MFSVELRQVIMKQVPESARYMELQPCDTRVIPGVQLLDTPWCRGNTLHLGSAVIAHFLRAKSATVADMPGGIANDWLPSQPLDIAPPFSCHRSCDHVQHHMLDIASTQLASCATTMLHKKDGTKCSSQNGYGVCVCEVASMEQYFKDGGTQKIVTKRYRTTEKIHSWLRPPPPALMGFEEEDGRFDPIIRQNPIPYLTIGASGNLS